MMRVVSLVLIVSRVCGLSYSSRPAAKSTELVVHKPRASRWGQPTKERSLGGWSELTWRGAARELSVDSYRISHILVATVGLGFELKERIEKANEDNEFERLAESISMCASGKDGGALGWLEKDSNEFCPELFSLSPPLRAGDMVVLETGLGTHVIRCDDVLVNKNHTIYHHHQQQKITQTKKIEKAYHLTTMGCQMNAADSERLEGSLEAAGLRKTEKADEAEVIILNTCSIRDKAEQKVYSHLGPYANRKKKGEALTIVVAGCVAQQEGERLVRRVPEIDVVMGPQFASRASDLIERAVEFGEQVVATEASLITEDVTKPRRASKVTAWINVIYGCNERCTYCVVPATRGIEQSRTPDAIIAELKDLQRQGYKEVTLLGQNIDAYGRDLRQRVSFYQLLQQCADAVRLEDQKKSSRFRIRFVTSHPRYMSDRVVDTVAQNSDVLMPVFHIPAQSGDDYMLSLMGRGYTRAKYLKIVDRIRTKVPDATITSDFIVGCPGESEKAFRNTLNLMETVRFDAAMLAAYSPRPGTPMARFDGASTAFDLLLDNEHSLAPADLFRRRLSDMNALNDLEDRVQTQFKAKAKKTDPARLTDLNTARDTARQAIASVRADPLFAFDQLAQIGPSQLPDDIKEIRLRQINDLQRVHALERSQRYLGREEEILVDQRNPKRPNQVVGRTRGNKLVFFEADPDLIGHFVLVRITQAHAFSLEGEFLELLE